MQRWILSGILSVAILSLMGIATATALWPEHALATGLHSVHSQWGGGHGRHGSGGHCGRLDGKHTELAAAYLDISLELTDEQSASLAPVMAVLDDWRVTIQASCESLDLNTAPGALAELETVLGDTQAAVVRLRPAFETFYDTLTPEQQGRLNELVNHRHHTEET